MLGVSVHMGSTASWGGFLQGQNDELTVWSASRN